MPRKVKSGLIQVGLPMSEGEGTIEEIKEAMVQKHLSFIDDAGKQGVQILCLQEIFSTFLISSFCHKHLVNNHLSLMTEIQGWIEVIPNYRSDSSL